MLYTYDQLLAAAKAYNEDYRANRERYYPMDEVDAMPVEEAAKGQLDKLLSFVAPSE